MARGGVKSEINLHVYVRAWSSWSSRNLVQQEKPVFGGYDLKFQF